MTTLHTNSLLFALTAWATLAWSVAQAADGTRYVSTTGNNANACTLAAPCRSLQRGIDRTPEGGELRILDSGFYGTNAMIRKSLTIAGNGNTIYLGSPLAINGAGAVVALRGLVLNGQGAAQDGIVVTSAAAVHVEHCVVHGFAQEGIDVDAGSGTNVFVTGSTVRDNDVGLEVSITTTTRISNSIFTGNKTGIVIGSGAVVETRGNNIVRGNTTNVVGTLTPFGGI